jgi:hypothetical protein
MHMLTGKGNTMSALEKTDLQNHVQSIADTLTSGTLEPRDFDGEEADAMDWLEGVLDMEYIVNSKKEYLGARVLVAFGGPNIWVDTRRGVVEGYWWGQYAEASFKDNLGIDDALQCLWSC